MHRVGIAFQLDASREEVLKQFIRPLRAALEDSRQGVYSNYLRQVDEDPSIPPEHLLVFQILDFKEGLRVLRLTLEGLSPPQEVTMHNLDPSSPSY